MVQMFEHWHIVSGNRRSLPLRGEPLWLSGKVVKNEKINEMRGPGFAPHPGQPLKKKFTAPTFP
jgi:hypothetical protein